ncbi:hypothetical protein DASC09_040490 [Saccharomycopsis crataegensis]|uniref:Fe2OG dioxygenase domain-containing protein n=1 Tax=Saccharomycopsis crataegensis TaxID=43959 RepID=A0AAV5QPV6_9ASCO|nr:hypothetical protein DASC09_040490 [Saccharomycopsis crataegensis]
MLEIIDISLATSGPELVSAAADQGFLFIKGHGYTPSEVEELFRLSEECFNLPHDTKMKYSLSDTENVGYTSIYAETLDTKNDDVGSAKGDPKETFNFGQLDFLTGIPNQRLPDIIGKDKSNLNILAYHIKKMYDISQKILELLAIGLQLEDPHWLKERFKQDMVSGSALRLLKYPTPDELDPTTEVRAGAHTDYGALTLLFQRQPGLEIFQKNQWVKVPSLESSNPEEASPMVVNIGDQLSYWTNKYLASTMHRVRFPEDAESQTNARYSIVFFCHPADNTVLEPLQSPLISAEKSEEKRLTAKQHLRRKLAAAYHWDGTS